eukprot:241732-Prymnesium_polylepis.1
MVALAEQMETRKAAITAQRAWRWLKQVRGIRQSTRVSVQPVAPSKKHKGFSFMTTSAMDMPLQRNSEETTRRKVRRSHDVNLGTPAFTRRLRSVSKDFVQGTASLSRGAIGALEFTQKQD